MVNYQRFNDLADELEVEERGEQREALELHQMRTFVENYLDQEKR